MIGSPWVEDGKLYNAVALLDGGRITGLRFKVDLPNYGVFDEKRVFAPGPLPGPVSFRGVRIGLPVCEDIWGPEPTECIAETGGEILLVPNGSPYRRGMVDERLNVPVARVTETRLPLLYVNQVGGQDELVFDGASFVLNRRRHACRAASGLPRGHRADALDADRQGLALRGSVHAMEEGDKADYMACMLGLRDYVQKNGFPGVVLGLSGGIDSALVRGAGRRCARPRARSRRDAAVSLHVAGVARRRGVRREGAWHSIRHRADRERGGRHRGNR